jgi:hypothetical protein
MDQPISESSVSLQLAAIQKRCEALMDKEGGVLELTLAEPEESAEDSDRYTLQR